MSNSLRDQLLGLGFKPAARPGPKPPRRGADHAHSQGGAARDGRSGQAADRNGGPRRASKGARKGARARGEIDLAKAYAIRAQREKEERIQAERERQEQARARREARARLARLLEGKALNAEDAEIARHFEYGGKIKRIYVTADQLRALNSGQLGVVQQNGRYLLVSAAVLAEAGAVFPQAVALRVDPDAPVEEDSYSDPRYQVPDDLVW